MKLHNWDVRERIGVEITVGAVDLSSAWVSVATDSLIIVEIDCRSKYPVVGPVSSHTVYLIAGEHTLGAINVDEATAINLKLPEGFEVGPIEVGRYSVAIFCYLRSEREHDKSVMIWEAK